MLTVQSSLIFSVAMKQMQVEEFFQGNICIYCENSNLILFERTSMVCETYKKSFIYKSNSNKYNIDYIIITKELNRVNLNKRIY